MYHQITDAINLKESKYCKQKGLEGRKKRENDLIIILHNKRNFLREENRQISKIVNIILLKQIVTSQIKNNNPTVVNVW